MELDRTFHKTRDEDKNKKSETIEIKVSKTTVKNKTKVGGMKPGLKSTLNPKLRKGGQLGNNLYDDNDQKDPDFNDEWSDNPNPGDVDDMERSRKLFKDFLVLQKIAGRTKTPSTSSHFPSEVLIDKGETIEISDDPNVNDKGDHHTSVMIHRDHSGEINSIEVLCKCGERTVIRLELSDDQNLDEVPDLED